MKQLKVNGRYLYFDDGTPFFYLGDTAWELLHKLTREETEVYLSERARQGFTAIQTVALAEMEGLTRPNAYGRLPLRIDRASGLPDPAEPDTAGPYSYWDHVDYVIEQAARHNLYVTLLPTWGDKFNLMWGQGPLVFTPENAFMYGRWIAARYAGRPNLIWMLGGDRPLDERTRPIIDQMARGIREVDQTHLVTFHPCGGTRSTDFLADAAYIDIHTSQSGHDVALCYQSDAVMRQMAEASDKPYMDSEPRYEDHPACFNPKLDYFWGEAEARQNAYWNMLSGACGHTYGNHNIWFFNTEPGEYFPFHWRDALTHPAAEQMRHVKRLRLRGDFSSLTPANEIFEENYAGEGHLAAAAGKGYAYIYTPLGLPFTADLSRVGQSKRPIKALWFDPRSGQETVTGIYPPDTRNLFVPPSSGKGCDWVLILEETA